ncbi:MAG: hypothetical protein IIB09_06710, partial [Bacteroidetes bacterium]|nr:hypothetical protein [Bacteroidota bacterium]
MPEKLRTATPLVLVALLAVACSSQPDTVASDLVAQADTLDPITAYSDAITGIVGSVGRSILYFDDAARTSPVPDPMNVDISNGEIIYTTVIDIGTSGFTMCELDGTMTFTVNTLPVAVPQVYAICEDLPPGSMISDNNNLHTLFDNLVTAGAAPRSVDWYFDPGGTPMVPGDLPPGSLIIPPADTDVDGIVDGQIFYALITNTATGCQNITSVTYDLLDRPGANPIVGQASVCASTTTV